MISRSPKRQDVERVLLKRSPADEGEPTVRFETTTYVAERRYGISEEHHAKSRECSVERGWFEWEHLGICLDEPYAFAPFSCALGERQHRSRQIDPHNCAVRHDCSGKFHRSLAPATTYIEHALSGLRGKRR